MSKDTHFKDRTLSAVSTKRAMTIADLFALKRIGDPQISPDGAHVVYTVTTADPVQNRTVTELWLRPANGSNLARQLTCSGKHDSHPRWSPDSKSVLFQSDRTGSSQLFVIDVATNVTTQATDIATDAENGIWSRDGHSIAFVSAVFPEHSHLPYSESNAANKERLSKGEQNKCSARVFTKLFYRHWNAYVGDRRQHIFVTAAPGCPPEARLETRDLTPGDRDAYPTSSTFEMGDDFTFSPDSKYIVYTAVPAENEAMNTNLTIARVPVTGGVSECLTPHNAAASDGPRFSPDGTMLAYRAQRRPGYESDHWELIFQPTDYSGTPQTVPYTRNESLYETHSVENFCWYDDVTLLISSYQNGYEELFLVSVDGEVLTTPNCVSIASVSTNNSGRIALLGSSLNSPPAVYVVDHPIALNRVGVIDRPGDWTSIKSITDENDELLAALDFTTVERADVQVKDGRFMQMWIVKPPAFDPAKKYPLVYMVHGGPQSVFAQSWMWRWNVALWAAQGYVVVQPNPRGSRGFGQKFMDDISRDWGGKCYSDLMCGLKYVKKLPFIDSNRMAAAGGSFGGYMMNWMNAHTTEFKAMVTHCGVFNFESMIATEEQWFHHWEYGGAPWETRAQTRKFSPHRYAQNMRTPTLVIHNDLDFRVPVSEGLQLFNTLKLLGVPAKMVNFPDEGHWVLKPANSVFWHEQIFAWFEQYIGTGSQG